MARTSSQRRDDLARSRGFRNYYDYRNHQAKSMGYASYGAQRKARKTGVGLKGSDIAVYGAQVTAPRAPASISQLSPPNLIPAGSAQARVAKTRARWAAVGANSRDYLLDEGKRFGSKGFVGAAFSDLKGLSSVNEQFSSEVEALFRDGWRQIDPSGSLNPSDVQRMRQLQEGAFRDLNRLQIDGVKDAQGLGKKLDGLRKDVEVNLDKEVKKLSKAGLKGRVYKNGTRRSIESSALASIDYYANSAFNEGTIRAALAMGIQALYVTDGRGCGWTDHSDTLEANGLYVTPDEALSYPIAHPHCQRMFHPAPDYPGRPGSLNEMRAALERAKAAGKGSAAKTAAKALGAVSATAAAGLAAKEVAQLLKSNPTFVGYARRLENAYRVARARGAAQAIDIRTGQLTNLTLKRIADEVQEDAIGWQSGRQISRQTREVIGINEMASRKVVGESFSDWNDFYRLRFQNSAGVGKVLQLPVEQVAGKTLESAGSSLNKFVGSRGPSFARISFPGFSTGSGVGRGLRGSLKLKDFATVRKTVRAEGSGSRIGLRRLFDLNLNPNGLLRAGFARDANTGLITPNFRLVPRGPIRISTKVNRSVSEKTFGRITSVSTEIRILTKRVPSINNMSTSLNVNLRALNIYKAEDILNLRVADFRRLKMDDLRFISVASDLHMKGLNIFDLQRSIRIPVDALPSIAKEIRQANFGLAYMNNMKILTVEAAEKVWLLGRQRSAVLIDYMERIVHRRPGKRHLTLLEGGETFGMGMPRDRSSLSAALDRISSGIQNVTFKDLDALNSFINSPIETISRAYRITSDAAWRLKEDVRRRLLRTLNDFKTRLSPGAPPAPVTVTSRGRAATTTARQVDNSPGAVTNPAAFAEFDVSRLGSPSSRFVDTDYGRIGQFKQRWRLTAFDNDTPGNEIWNFGSFEMSIPRQMTKRQEELVLRAARVFEDMDSRYAHTFSGRPQNFLRFDFASSSARGHIAELEPMAPQFIAGPNGIAKMRMQTMRFFSEMHDGFDSYLNVARRNMIPDVSGSSFSVPIRNGMDLRMHTIVHETGHSLRFAVADEVGDAVDSAILKKISAARPETVQRASSRLGISPEKLTLADWFNANIDEVSRSLSQYATTHYEEMFAEAWAQFSIGSRPTWLSDIIGDTLDRAAKGLPYE